MDLQYTSVGDLHASFNILECDEFPSSRPPAHPSSLQGANAKVLVPLKFLVLSASLKLFHEQLFKSTLSPNHDAVQCKPSGEPVTNPFSNHCAGDKYQAPSTERP